MTDSPPEKPKRDAIQTFNDAYRACGELWFGEQATPTVVAVCERIGRKHTAVVSRALKAWKEDVGFEDLLSQRREAIRRPAPPPEVSSEPDFSQAVAELYRKAKTQAWQELEAERQALAEERERLHAAVAVAEAARDMTLKEWDAYKLGTEREAAMSRERIAQLEHALAEVQQQQGRAERQWRAEADARLAEAVRWQTEAASLQRTITELKETHRQALESLRGQVEQDHEWHLARIAEERELAQAEMREKIAGLREALAQAQGNVATLNGYLDRSAAAAGELRGELKAEKAALAGLREELDAARRQAEAQAQRTHEAQRRLADCEAQRNRLQAALAAHSADRDEPSPPASNVRIPRKGPEV